MNSLLLCDTKCCKKSVLEQWDIPYRLIVSLTSFPERIPFVSLTVKSIMNQTIKPDSIILWLAETEFPGREKDLPEELLCLVDLGLQISFCEENIGPHKKYYYTMREHPESIVVTVDDDVEYPSYLIEDLIRSYLSYPFAVSATFAHLISFDSEGNIKPYSQWIQKYDNGGRPSLALMGVGIGGILYPPHCMDYELFNLESIKELCLYADDLWLKIMQVAQKTPVVVAGRHRGFKNIEGTQVKALYHANLREDRNTEYLKLILSKYNYFWDKTGSISSLLRLSANNLHGGALELNLLDLTSKLNKTRKELEEANRNISNQNSEILGLKNEISFIENSVSFKIGRMLTAPVRWLRDSIRSILDDGIKPK